MHRGSAKAILASGLLLLATLGCGAAARPSADETPNESAAAGEEFDLQTAGQIQGQVRWDGTVPTVAPFEVLPNPLGGGAFQKMQLRPNPNAPLIEAHTQGVAHVVVFLRGLEPRRGRSWNHPPVRVELRDERFHVMQGDADSPLGFVRQGDSLEMVSRDRHFHSVHAGGAAFFGLAFPDPDSPITRSLHDKGIVELTSAAGCFWMRAYVFVADHPYYTRTDPEGRFVLAQVPPGRYEIVCWMPSWRQARHERDPESGFITRLFFDPPLERVQTLTLGANETKEVAFTVSAEMFVRPAGEAQDCSSVLVTPPLTR